MGSRRSWNGQSTGKDLDPDRFDRFALNEATTDPDVNSFGWTSQGFNIIGNNKNVTITAGQAGDQIGTLVSPRNPLLGPLQDNGSTKTRALLSDSLAASPAIATGH